MGLLDGKVALITGAGGGLGEAYAKLFAREGAAVVVNDLGGPRDGSGGDASMAQKVVDAIKAEGGRAVANGADISTMAGGQSVFDDAIKNFGRADILVNNAGILLDQTFAKASEAAWDKVIKVHLKGTFCCTQPVFRWMREHGGGVIVNTSSTSGLIGNFGQTNYGAAKGGIWGLSNVLAIEGRKYNIRVWTLAPGALTRMTADLPRYIENPGCGAGAGRHRAGRAIHGQRFVGRPDRQGARRLRPARRARDADDGNGRLEAAAYRLEGRGRRRPMPGRFSSRRSRSRWARGGSESAAWSLKNNGRRHTMTKLTPRPQAPSPSRRRRSTTTAASTTSRSTG